MSVTGFKNNCRQCSRDIRISMVSVTTVLNRLVAYGEARAVALENGRRAWKWIADSEPESVPS